MDRPRRFVGQPTLLPPPTLTPPASWATSPPPTSGFTEALAGGGLSNLGGSNDLSFIVDPFGTAGSTADAGLGYNFDLAGVLGDNLAATATGANNLIDIRRAEASGALVAAPRTS